MGRENLPKGKYLVASSTGRDAADILIVMAIYDITKLYPNKEIILLTNDHFGVSMQEIFKERGI